MAIDKIIGANVDTYNNTPKKSNSVKEVNNKVISKQLENTTNVQVFSGSRSAKLDEIAKQIKNNTFKVDPNAIAEKMLKDKNTIKLLLES